MRRLLLMLALLTLAPLAALAITPDELLPDPAQEARAREVSRELRCVVCQSESIDESNADIARDLRLLVRERIKAGDSNEQVIDYVVDRYGEFVLFKPRMTLANAPLWFGGPILLVFGLVLVGAVLRRRARDAGEQRRDLTPEEQARIDRLLDDPGGPTADPARPAPGARPSEGIDPPLGPVGVPPPATPAASGGSEAEGGSKTGDGSKTGGADPAERR